MDTTPAFNKALTALGHEALRPGQADVIADIFAGHPVVALMPTGAGKSLCYQLPAMVLAESGGVTLVVSPLIALMKDQVDSLTTRGVAAVALTSAANQDEQREILDGLRAGLYALVYVAPERFRSPRFVDALRALGKRLALVAIDEAHCISEWGHDFRPEYRRLGEVVAELAPPRVAAFTATATPEVRADIGTQLKMLSPRVHVRGFDRPNLHYAVQPTGGAADKAAHLIELVRTRESGVALVYAATRKNAEKFALELKAAGMRARVYHAGLEDSVRERNQDVFMAGKLDVIVATNAFGMGVDKSDIRLVVHADLPRSPEAYYQEAGRGGRDGKPTRAILLFNHGDVRLQEFLIDASYPSAAVLRGVWKLLRDEPSLGAQDAQFEERLRERIPEDVSAAAMGSCVRILERHGMLRSDGQAWQATRPEPGAFPVLDVDALARRADVERKKLKLMVDYAYTNGCRRQYVLDYFGDPAWSDKARRCGACDNCDALANGATPGLPDSVATAIRDVLAMIGAISGRFGRMRLAALAIGDDEDERFEDLPDRGCLRGWKQKDALELLRALETAGLIEASRGEYPTIGTTRQGDRVALGQISPADAGVRLLVTKASRTRPKTRTGRSAAKRVY